MYKFIFFIILFVCLFPLTAEATNEQILKAKIELLAKQVEVLSAQLALLTGTDFTPLERKCAQAEVSWERVSKANKYQLYRDGSLIYQGRNRSFIDSDLIPGKEYEYVVYGLYRDQRGDPSDVKNITAPSVCPPHAPRLYFQAKPCGGSISVSWNKDHKATTYQLFRGRRKIYEGPLTSFSDSRLRPNQSYEYKIRAGNRGGWGEFSEPVSFNASSVCAPSAPEVSQVISQTEVAEEGDLSIERRSSPAENNRVRAGYSNQRVVTFDLDARYSNITVVRIDLYFNSQVWRYLEEVRVRQGLRTVSEIEVDRDSFTSIGSGIYRLRIDNIDPVVKKDRSTILTVDVTPKESYSGDDPHYITVFLENNSVRAVDDAGFLHYLPKSGGGEDGEFSRTFYIE